MLRFGDAVGAAFLPNEQVVVASHRSVSLFTLDGTRLVSLNALSGKSAGYALGSGKSPFVEILGPDVVSARAALSCRAGELLFRFEVCSDRFEVSGMVAKASAGQAYEDEPFE